MSVIQYDRNRFPVQPGKKLCRGCHCPVPKYRSSWCSDKCHDTYEPKRVRYFCKQRDKGVCSFCGTDCERMRRRFQRASGWRPPAPNQRRYFREGMFQREAYDRALAIIRRHEQRWILAAKKRVERMKLEGWPRWTSRDWWEMDHVTPFSEGGITVLENVRTLCVVCHKKRTKKWHKERTR